MSALGDADFRLHGAWDEPGTHAGALVFAVDAEGRVLLQLRDARPGVQQGGLWAPFGGGVEPGEGLAEAACREFAEETGLVLAPEALTPLGRALSGTPRRARLYAFAARCPRPAEAIRLAEGAGFAFLTLAQLRAFPLVPAIRAMAMAAPAAVGRPPAP